MFGIWDVWDVGCSGCGMFEIWDVGDVGCSECGMFGMWDVECRMFAGMWDVDFQNTGKNTFISIHFRLKFLCEDFKVFYLFITQSGTSPNFFQNV